MVQTPATLPYVSIRQHTSAYVSIRQHTAAYIQTPAPLPTTFACAYVST
jgi:hypothetical protein